MVQVHGGEPNGSVVQWLGRWLVTSVMGVRFPSDPPTLNNIKFIMKQAYGELMFYAFIVILILGLFWGLSTISEDTQKALMWWLLMQQND